MSQTGTSATTSYVGTELSAAIQPSRGEGSINAGLVVETNHDLGFFTDTALVGLGNTSGLRLDAGVRYRF